MKQRILTFATIALMIFSIGCKKSDKDTLEPVVNSANGKFSGKVDNVSFESSEIGCISDHDEEGSFLMAVVDKDNNSIIISAPNKKGTFTGGDSDESATGIYQDKVGKMWMSEMDGGTVTVTISKFDKSSKKISGTFSFTAPAFTTTEATGTKTVNGSFTDVNYAAGTDDDDE